MEALLIELVVKQVIKHFYKVLGLTSLGPFSFIVTYVVEKVVTTAITETILAVEIAAIDRTVDGEYEEVIKAKDNYDDEESEENEKALIDAYRKLLSF